MLKKIYIDRFRHFRNFVFEPSGQNTILCGLNGTGKSTIVEILSKLQLFLVNGAPVNSVCKFEDIPKWDLKEYGVHSSEIGIDITIKDIEYSYNLEIKYNLKEAICRVEKESLKCGNNIIFASNNGNCIIATDDKKEIKYPVDWSFTGLVVAERFSSKIRKFIQYIKSNLFPVALNPYSLSGSHQESQPILNLDGSNFSAWYDFLRDEQLPVIAGLFSEISAFVPGFKQFVLEKEGKNRELTADILFNAEQAYRIPFDSLSHGQKILCVLHILLRITPKDSIIVIDEFENFLAPIELQPLYDAAQDAFEEKNIQFIFISHHHKTMNWFQDTAFILLFSGAPAFVRIEKFSSDLEIGIDEYLLEKSEQ
ncbi:MAG: AAA family ATPase [Desulfovibrio sp.]|jgi:AAA15 family ATPase/GTPase|nr:AAA family ATPase [Desulfovibrio sp.]